MNEIINEKIETMFNAISNFCEYLNLQYAKTFALNIENKIESDFLAIKKYTEAKEIKILYSQFKIYVHSLIGLRTKSFLKVLELQNELGMEQEDFVEYIENFSYIEEELKNKIFHIFSTYFQIIESKGQVEDFKELYVFYQMTMIYVLHLLPKNYRQSLIEQENFKDLSQEISKIAYEENFKNINLGRKYISCLEDYIRKYILAKYGIDLFEFHESRERKRI